MIWVSLVRHPSLQPSTYSRWTDLEMVPSLGYRWDMRCLVPLLFLFLAPAAWADSMPIRGATGDGFGQFAWGTSLATVEKLSPKMKAHPEEWRVRFERTALTRLRKADRAKKRSTLRRAPKGGARFAGYRYWVKMDGLEGRVTLSFYRDQLFEANVALIFTHKSRGRAAALVRTLVKKYGEPQARADGTAPKLDSIKLLIPTDGGTLTVYRTPAKKGTNGYLKLVYHSDVFGAQAEQRISDLRARISHLESAQSSLRKSRRKKSPADDRIRRRVMEQF